MLLNDFDLKLSDENKREQLNNALQYTALCHCQFVTEGYKFMHADVIHIVVAAKRVLLTGRATRFPFEMIIHF